MCFSTTAKTKYPRGLCNFRAIRCFKFSFLAFLDLVIIIRSNKKIKNKITRTMCDRNDTPAGENSLVFQRFKKKLIETGFKAKCRKCEIADGRVLLQKKDVLCGECLIDYCTRKFRATIGKSKLLKPGEAVLVACSGGTSSISLIDMIKVGLAQDEHCRLRFVPALVHIDESILNCDDIESQNSLECEPLPRQLFDYMLDSGVDCYFTSLESLGSIGEPIESIDDPGYIRIDAIRNDIDRSAKLDESYERVRKYLRLRHEKCGDRWLAAGFRRLRSLSSKHDFVTRLRQLILVKIAQHANFRRIFVGSTTTELSTTLMSHISMGRGVELHAEMNFCDDRYPSSITVLRPLREFAQKELAFYARYRDLHRIAIPKASSTDTLTPIKASIYKLTENFLNSLAEEFPATIYTVFKTGNKITSAIDAGSKQKAASNKIENNQSMIERCRFCYAKIDINDGDEYRAFDAFRLTSQLSLGLDQITKINENDETDLSQSTSSSITNSAKYCYACSRLRSEINSSIDSCQLNLRNTENGQKDLFLNFCIL